jgi:hypothetical protein
MEVRGEEDDQTEGQEEQKEGKKCKRTKMKAEKKM